MQLFLTPTTTALARNYFFLYLKFGLTLRALFQAIEAIVSELLQRTENQLLSLRKNIRCLHILDMFSLVPFQEHTEPSAQIARRDPP